MLNKTRIATAISTGAILFNTFAATAFASVEQSGNGSFSSNTTNVSANQSSSVNQSNDSNISNYVNNTSNTGGNDSSDNTGGSVFVNTGNTTATVDIRNRANLNHAEISSNSPSGDSTITQEGNGSSSTNNVNQTSNSSETIKQNNDASINNTVKNNQTTGGNTASRNTGSTGGGSVVEVISGNAISQTSLRNAANANIARVGQEGGSTGGAAATITQEGNGSFSKSSTTVSHNHSVSLRQLNDADFYSGVYNTAKTGWNTADDNTGANVLIDAGGVAQGILIDNLANFNWAEDSSGNMMVVTNATTSGNGSSSTNKITSSSNHSSTIKQINDADLRNSIHNHGATGGNSSSRNTGATTGSSQNTVFTGNHTSQTTVGNHTNKNVVGSMSAGGLLWEFSFDWDNLLGLL